MLRIGSLFWLVACGAPEAEPSDPKPPTSTEAPNLDADRVRALIAGTADLDETLMAVAWSGGWPVRTDEGTWIFVAVSDADDVALSGDFNGWAPAPMTPGEGFHWLEIGVAQPEGLGYKFTSGAAELEADPWARSYTHDAFGSLSYVAPPLDDWHLERWPKAEFGVLEARDLRVYVPPGAGPWPTVYAHDGQNLFDPAATWGGWRLQEALDGLPDLLVVGIDNTSARMDEYTHVADILEPGGALYGGQAEDYAAALRDGIRPHIEQVYGEPSASAVMGSSLGGLVSLFIAAEQPGQWDMAISLSGTLGWGRFGLDNPTIQEWTLGAGPDAVLYLDSGGDSGVDGVCTDPDGDGFTEDDPESSDNYCTTRQMADALGASGWVWNADLYHWHEPGALHNEAAWAGRVERPLGIFAGL